MNQWTYYCKRNTLVSVLVGIDWDICVKVLHEVQWIPPNP